MWRIYWICGVCHAANVQTEGMILIYMVLLVRTRRTARALRAARSVAPIRAHFNSYHLFTDVNNYGKAALYWQFVRCHTSSRIFGHDVLPSAQYKNNKSLQDPILKKGTKKDVMLTGWCYFRC